MCERENGNGGKRGEMAILLHGSFERCLKLEILTFNCNSHSHSTVLGLYATLSLFVVIWMSILDCKARVKTQDQKRQDENTAY